MSIIDYINMASIGDMFYGAPRAVPNPNYRVPPTERVPPVEGVQYQRAYNQSKEP